ncbi:MAG: hypothetical protein H7293_15410, partial [Candidatus Saccharibacteria bacterium]|nr:hypothetical protein [Rhodoferax sp.]
MASEPAGCGHYKVEIKNGDLRDLPFAEGIFDAVKPGGRLAITNIRHSAEYARVLTGLGLADV